MSAHNIWFIPGRLGPVRTEAAATRVGVSLAPTIVVGHLLVVPVDDQGWCRCCVVIADGRWWPSTLDTVLADGALWTGKPPTRSVVLFTRRHHDIIDEADAERSMIMGSWLATNGIELLDWYIITRHSARSILGDFGLPRHW